VKEREREKQGEVEKDESSLSIRFFQQQIY